MDTCSIEIIKDSTNPRIDKTRQKVIAVSLFRVVDRKSTEGRLAVYLNGVELYCKAYKKLRPDWSVRVYIDDSLYSPLEAHRKETLMFREYLDTIFPKYDNLQIYKISCSAHKADEYHHVGLFGSMLRFFAGFDENVDVVLFRDSDFSRNSIEHDINNVDVWLSTTSDKYMFGINPGYTPAHADNKEAFFAGLWGVRGGLLPSLFMKMDEIIKHPEYTFLKAAKAKVKLIYNILERAQDKYEIFPTSDDEETDELCDLNLTRLERIERLGDGVDKSPLVNLAKKIPRLDSEDKQKYIDLIDSILICVDVPYYTPAQIIDILGVYDVIMKSVYRYGVDEIMMNHILKRELFGIDKADNANDVPVSMIYFIQNNRDKYFNFDDYYNYFLPKKIRLGDPGVYSFQYLSQYERLQQLYKKYLNSIKKVSCFFYITIDPWLLLEPLVNATCATKGGKKISSECASVFAAAVKQSNLLNRTKFKLSDVWTAFGTDLKVLLADPPTPEERFINEFMKQLYLLSGGKVVTRLDRVLQYFQIPSYEEYQDKLIRNLLA